ncbi:hypothetical protein SAMN05421663_104216 [Terribacillus halophilus]|uniref:Nucleotidyltransferase domain-containing protein n=2 Tax=Terribacillus halophilus TaxID=361279 RepID=A0A1G6PPH8_9BACI|nr:hypothetical protein SAMN05421663_104216 [Terribacillus halophilus]
MNVKRRRCLIGTNKKIGRFCANDVKGYIVNEARKEWIDPVYDDLIKRVVQVYKDQLGPNLHSIYIRGSIPRGLGIVGVSDLDTLCITNNKMDELDLTWVNKAENEINQAFSCVNGVELSFYHIEEICNSSTFSIIPFMIKTHSICVYGKDAGHHLPSYRADRTLANDHIINLQQYIESAKHDLQGNEDKEDILDCCIWIMKIIIRAGLALIMEIEKQYTRDLYPAYKAFAKHFPDQEPNMRQALDYAINPSPDAEQLLSFLNEMGEWMVKESEKWLMIHNPDRLRKMNLNE